MNDFMKINNLWTRMNNKFVMVVLILRKGYKETVNESKRTLTKYLSVFVFIVIVTHCTMHLKTWTFMHKI